MASNSIIIRGHKEAIDAVYYNFFNDKDSNYNWNLSSLYEESTDNT